MKTDVIEVRDMLSILSVEGVEAKINDVPGVESSTVNYDAGTATVRYDETRLKAADIKPAVHQAGYQSKEPPKHQQEAATPLKDSPDKAATTAASNAPKDDASKTATQATMPKATAAPTDAKAEAFKSTESASTASASKNESPAK